MTVTFTQADVKLSFNRANLTDVLNELDNLMADNPNNVYTVNTSFHVGSVDQADKVLSSLDKLLALRAIDQHQWQMHTGNIRSFKKLYLK